MYTEAAMQVLIGFDSGRVIAIFPERSLPILALVIFLRGATRVTDEGEKRH
jgi:hypothetical protein